MKSMKSSTFKLLAALFSAIIALGGIFFGMSKVEDYFVKKADANIISSVPATSYQEKNYIYHNNKKYKPKDYVDTVLLIGTDSQGKIYESTAYNNQNKADFLALLIFDNNNKTCTVLQINRDTVTEINVLGVTGEKAGTIRGQIALAHTYGNGLEQSCKNTVKAVSNFLYQIEIDNYLSMNMDAVSALNDVVGGVEVEILDDFSEIDPTLIQGETILLNGKQALTYVRGRGNVGDMTNTSRMARQRQYMAAFAEKIKSAYQSDDELVLNAYNAITDYTVTDCSITVLSDTAEMLSSYEIKDIITPEGEIVDSEEYIEFHADNDKLKDLIVNLFYDEISE
ncbi:MAG: LCP family protein [Clostridia bacterium]|nr:LCP family protein [Clostridia bacterium]